MSKCVVCGQKGLFLKINDMGMCANCSNVYKAEFEAYYDSITSCLSSLKESINVGTDPIAALEYIPLLNEKLNTCEILQNEIHNPKYEKQFIERIISSITYRDDFNKRYGIGALKEWEITVFADSRTKEFSPKGILESLDKQINSFKFKWKQKIQTVQDNASFQRTMEAIPSAKVNTSNATFSKNAVSALDELIKYSSITAKTSFDKIGNFVAIDVETTGLSSTRDTLLEIAAIKFEDWTPVEKFHTLINPEKHIPDETTAINNITDEMVSNAPTFPQIIESLNSFVGKFCIVGHNLSFDLKFLYRYGYDFTKEKRRYYDTYEISKKTLKKPKMKWDREYEEYVINYDCYYDVEDYKLTTLCEFYKIRDNSFAHRALSDALATGLLFKKLAESKIDC